MVVAHLKEEELTIVALLILVGLPKLMRLRSGPLITMKRKIPTQAR